ncbi:MAG: hypothetical protein WD801_00135 [Gemmatimonadaceae bacterium]
MMRPFLLALALTSLVPTPAHAQFTERVQTGARVRVWIPEAYLQEQGPWRRLQLRATLAGMSDDTLHLTVPGTLGALAVPRSAIRRLDVSKGPPSRVESAVERAIGFALAGAISAAVSNDPASTEWPHYNRTWRAAEVGAKFGAALGAVVGFVLPTERWRRVRLPR